MKIAVCIALGVCEAVYAFGSRLQRDATDGQEGSMFFSPVPPAPHGLSGWALGSGAVNVRLDRAR